MRINNINELSHIQNNFSQKNLCNVTNLFTLPFWQLNGMLKYENKIHLYASHCI